LGVEILQALKTELQTDPAPRGYAGKTPALQADLLNEPISQSP
jgi:hypothetical protein